QAPARIRSDPPAIGSNWTNQLRPPTLPTANSCSNHLSTRLDPHRRLGTIPLIPCATRYATNVWFHPTAAVAEARCCNYPANREDVLIKSGDSWRWHLLGAETIDPLLLSRPYVWSAGRHPIFLQIIGQTGAVFHLPCVRAALTRSLLFVFVISPAHTFCSCIGRCRAFDPPLLRRFRWILPIPPPAPHRLWALANHGYSDELLPMPTAKTTSNVAAQALMIGRSAGRSAHSARHYRSPAIESEPPTADLVTVSRAEQAWWHDRQGLALM
ncbi:unnamed protein product, partial [Protopolystoma xenopodis]